MRSDRLPRGAEKQLPDLKVLERYRDGSVLILVPRYDAFMRYASALARNGANFREIAGNSSVILVTALVSRDWKSPGDAQLLFEQPILTLPETKRVALVVPVASLAAALKGLREHGGRLEHIFDY